MTDNDTKTPDGWPPEYVFDDDEFGELFGWSRGEGSSPVWVGRYDDLVNHHVEGSDVQLEAQEISRVAAHKHHATTREAKLERAIVELREELRRREHDTNPGTCLTEDEARGYAIMCDLVDSLMESVGVGVPRG